MIRVPVPDSNKTSAMTPCLSRTGASGCTQGGAACCTNLALAHGSVDVSTFTLGLRARIRSRSVGKAN